jgi:hypothetical protein
MVIDFVNAHKVEVHCFFSMDAGSERDSALLHLTNRVRAIGPAQTVDDYCHVVLEPKSALLF